MFIVAAILVDYSVHPKERRPIYESCHQRFTCIFELTFYWDCCGTSI